MIESNDYKILKWVTWDDYFADAIAEFKKEHGLMPNYIAASEHTFDQIHYVINLIPGSHKNVVGITADGKREMFTSEEKLEIEGFEVGGESLDFLINEERESGVFNVLYATDDELFGDDDEDDNNDDPDFDPTVLPDRAKPLVKEHA